MVVPTLPSASVRRGLVALLALALLAPGLAGCVALRPGADAPEDDLARTGAPTPTTPTDDAPPAEPSPEPEPEPEPEPQPRPEVAELPPSWTAGPQVVVAVVDSGINPYHREFRDPTPLGLEHPSTYIPGYPRDAEPLRLTLGATTLEEALEADEAAWAAVKPGVLYFVPGTRIVGLRSEAQDGARAGFDDHGHGTMSASRAAGLTTSLAPTARIVAVEGLTLEAVRWVTEQPWIDVQSHSWVDLALSPASRAAFAAAAREQPVFAAAGNGVGQYVGGVGQPAFAGPTQGAPGVVAVGGHDNGRVTPWTGTVPHVVADACWSVAADAASMDRTGPRVGSGTSAATPYVAGAAARLVLEARALVGDRGVSHAGGVLASGVRAVPGDGPLSDGALTLDELKAVLLKTAIPRPEATPHDGDVCDFTMAPYATAPLEWGSVPADAPAYYFVGYGAVNERSLAAALAVLRGESPMPTREREDGFFAADATVRDVLG